MSAPRPKREPTRPARTKKSWRQKLEDDKGLPKVVVLDGEAAKRWQGRTLAVPSPREVDALMRRVPRGRLITLTELRAAVARRHHADVACPFTTGIFSWTAAHAAAEEAAAGAAKVTPYWRTLNVNGELNPKYPGGIDALTARLEAEGHRIIRKGNRSFVANYERVLAKPVG